MGSIMFSRIFRPELRDIYEGIAAGLLGVFWIFVVGSTLLRIEQYSPVFILQVCTVLVGFLGICVAISKLVSDQRWRESEVYLEQSMDLFDKSFKALVVDESTGYPLSSRTNWLTSARLLLAAQELGKKISQSSHINTYNEYLEFWRFEFRNLLCFSVDGGPEPEYFYEEGFLHAWNDRVRAPIAERTIAIFYRFMEWPNDKEDYLDSHPDFTSEELDNMLKRGAHNIVRYVELSRANQS